MLCMSVFDVPLRLPINDMLIMQVQNARTSTFSFNTLPLFFSFSSLISTLTFKRAANSLLGLFWLFIAFMAYFLTTGMCSLTSGKTVDDGKDR